MHSATYLRYSIGLAVVWVVVLAVVALRGDAARRQTMLTLAGGVATGWLSATGARWV